MYAVFAPLLRALLSKALGASGSGASVLKVKWASHSVEELALSQMSKYRVPITATTLPGELCICVVS